MQVAGSLAPRPRRRARSPRRAPVRGLRAPRLVVMVAVAGLVGVVVGRGGGADLLLEAGQGDAVDANVAVHADVALEGLRGSAPDQKVSHPRVGPEVSGVAHLDIGVGLRRNLRLCSLMRSSRTPVKRK